MNREYISISDINKIVKYTIDSNPELSNIYIKGEISNFKYHTRGHLYFSLKDEKAKDNYKESYYPKIDNKQVVITNYFIYGRSLNLEGFF